MSNGPALFRPPKSSGTGPGQYWGGGPPGKTSGCCQLLPFPAQAKLMQHPVASQPLPPPSPSPKLPSCCPLARLGQGSNFAIWGRGRGRRNLGEGEGRNLGEGEGEAQFGGGGGGGAIWAARTKKTPPWIPSPPTPRNSRSPRSMTISDTLELWSSEEAPLLLHSEKQPENAQLKSSPGAPQNNTLARHVYQAATKGVVVSRPARDNQL